MEKIKTTKYHIHKSNNKIPPGVLIITIPKEKQMWWFYYREQNKEFYGDFFDIGREITIDIEKETINLFLLQINDSIKKINNNKK